MTLREYTLGPREKTQVFFSETEDKEELSDILKRVRKWVKEEEAASRIFPYEVNVRLDDAGCFHASVNFSE